ncbi:MBL fold metallo-hydrolase [Nocardiopsis composta]|uniref:Glyoxylase-like metal-dependent hydrolase (Beta-lactamase superfamily II) n=1 Tax=Nocardiopsis composta TaxID=157465 RepID=A0A7W8QQM7_9ACTN|nr:MBL fold metallo-hydrolase [Nocardiopsis composta]MBB5434792.1 glyoxylase-like metal-dependent hydrolase (beta-lactamase superfamily II) [Nocardiopsis composta]
MFWKRKGKKKDGEATGEAATVTLDEARDEPDTAVQDGEGDADGKKPAEASSAGEAEEKKAAKAGSEEKDAAAEKSAEADADSEDADGAEEKADSAESEKSDEKSEKKDAAEEKPAEDEAAGGEEDTEKDSSADAEDSSGESESDEDGSDGGDDSEKESGEKAEAAKKREIEPEEPGIGEPDSDGVQRVRTAGALKVDDEEYPVVSNTWIVKADDEGVIVIDPAHDAELILEAVGDREIYLVACTNGYNTHIEAAQEVAERDEAPIALHRREVRSWRRVHGAENPPEIEVEGGGSLKAGDLEIDILPLPGTSSGTVGYYIAELGAVFSGDTLRAGELGTVGDGYLDYTRQLHSVGEVLLSLPPDTRILPDQGPETTVEEESGNFNSWV